MEWNGDAGNCSVYCCVYEEEEEEEKMLRRGREKKQERKGIFVLNVSGRVFSFRDDGKECAARVQSCENPELCSAGLCSGSYQPTPSTI